MPSREKETGWLYQPSTSVPRDVVRAPTVGGVASRLIVHVEAAALAAAARAHRAGEGDAGRIAPHLLVPAVLRVAGAGGEDERDEHVGAVPVRAARSGRAAGGAVRHDAVRLRRLRERQEGGREDGRCEGRLHRASSRAAFSTSAPAARTTPATASAAHTGIASPPSGTAAGVEKKRSGERHRSASGHRRTARRRTVCARGAACAAGCFRGCFAGGGGAARGAAAGVAACTVGVARTGGAAAKTPTAAARRAGGAPG